MAEQRRHPGLISILAMIALCAAGLAVWIAIADDAARVWRAMLINFSFFTPLAGGLVAWSAIVRISRGRWAGRAERLPLSGLGFALPSLTMLGALWLASPHWAPWYSMHLPQGLWLDNTFLFARDLLGLTAYWLAAWWYVRQRTAGRRRTRLAGSLLLLLYGAVFSLLGFDLVMGLDPYWSSSLFGSYFFVSGLYSGVAAWTLWSAIQGEAEADQLHDLGNLVLAFSMLTTYMFFAQLLPIWYENLEPETRFVIPRMNEEGWRPLSIGLLACFYLGPMVMLFFTWVKRHRRSLAAVSTLILVAAWAERWWLVSPRFVPRIELGAPEIAPAVSLGALLLLACGLLLPRLPEILPESEEAG